MDEWPPFPGILGTCHVTCHLGHIIHCLLTDIIHGVGLTLYAQTLDTLCHE